MLYAMVNVAAGLKRWQVPARYIYGQTQRLAWHVCTCAGDPELFAVLEAGTAWVVDTYEVRQHAWVMAGACTYAWATPAARRGDKCMSMWTSGMRWLKPLHQTHTHTLTPLARGYPHAQKCMHFLPSLQGRLAGRLMLLCQPSWRPFQKLLSAHQHITHLPVLSCRRTPSALFAPVTVRCFVSMWSAANHSSWCR